MFSDRGIRRFGPHRILGMVSPGAVLFICLCLASPPGQAIVITSAANNYAFNWSFDTGAYALTGNGVLTVSQFNSNRLRIVFSVANTSPHAGVGGDRLVSLGFGIGPNATAVSFVDSNDGRLRAGNFIHSGAMVSNVPGVEICVRGGRNCSGGASDGVYAGATEAFTLLLRGNWGDEVDIDPIGLRYQTGSGSFTFPVQPSSSVPAPGPLALFLVGLVGIATHRRVATLRGTGGTAPPSADYAPVIALDTPRGRRGYR